MCGTEATLVVRHSPANTITIPHHTTQNANVDRVINLDHGDPAMYESYWRKMSKRSAITFAGDERLSYFSDVNKVCWFLEPQLEEEIRRLHSVVGNAAVDSHHYIIVGNGSSQLIQAALYALSSQHSDQPRPVSVVSAAPYYSSYPEMTEFLQSGLYKWEGDAREFEKDGAYIELITSPNNPDGVLRRAVVNNNNKGEGSFVHDLAYYWPQYTAITSPANHDLMLFTVSKCTGHAGSRIGWAVVRNKEVAKKMTKFMEISTIGVSKESQLRAAKILGIVCDSCSNMISNNPKIENLFEYTHKLMYQRWQKLRQVVKAGQLFTLQKYPIQYCRFARDFTETLPAFAWMMCKGREEDCEKLLRGHNILTRSGTKFGVDSKFVRISMLGKEDDFNIFLQRLSTLQQTATTY